MLKRMLGYALVVGFAAASPYRPAFAQERPGVTVRVELVAPLYHDRMRNRAAVEKQAAMLFARYLTRNVGFLRFAADDSIRPYRLTFRLDRLDRTSTKEAVEYGFWAHLDRDQETAVEVYWLPFRTPDQAFSGVGSENEFLVKIDSKLAHREADSVPVSVLRWVPVSETGLLTSQDPNVLVVLPFPLLDLCMKKQSMVEIVAEVGTPSPLEQEFKAKVEGNFTPSTPRDESFRGNGLARVLDATTSFPVATAKVRRIFVTGYIHDATACDNRTPLAIGGAP